VDEGQAWAYRHFTDQYVKGEEKARRKRKGLWKDSQPMAPWEWRQKMRYSAY
jgi:endonuclease YncB( thermonuclease family)